MSATGHFHIKNALKKSGAPLAGEMSGHIFFNDNGMDLMMAIILPLD